MKTLKEIKQLLQQQKTLFKEDYRITEIGIFGSYARGEETAESDIDVLVHYNQAPTLTKLVEFREYLISLTGMKVDVVTKNGLKPKLREKVLAEVIYL